MTDRTAKAADLLKTMARSRAVACDMVHEAVEHGDNAVRMGATFARPGICGAALRKHNLACAHTTARYALRDALVLLAEGQDRASHYVALVSEWPELDAAFGRLDHRRYDVEDAKAAAMRSGDETALTVATAAIAQTVSEHRDLVAKLEMITRDVRAALERIVTPCPDAADAQPHSQLKIAS